MDGENTAREQEETQDHVSTNTITDTHSAELLVTSEIFHTTICRMDSSPYFQQPHCIFERSSIESTVHKLYFGF